MPTIRAARRPRRQLGVFPIALGLASLLVTAIPAASSAAIHPDQAVRRTREVPAQPSEEIRLTVTCPKGMRVVAGGAGFVGAGLSSGAVSPYIHVSTPTQDGKGWRGAGVASLAALAPIDLELSLQVSILCRPAAAVGRYTVVVRETRPDSEGLASTSADCGAGKRVVVGGAGWRRSHGTDGWSVLLASGPRPNARGWRAHGYTLTGKKDGSDTNDALRVVLLCRPVGSLPGLSVRTIDLEADAVQRTGRVSCPTGKRVTTGGLEWLLDGAPDRRGFLRASRLTVDGKGWYVAATADVPELTARVRVLCLPR